MNRKSFFKLSALAGLALSSTSKMAQAAFISKKSLKAASSGRRVFETGKPNKVEIPVSKKFAEEIQKAKDDFALKCVDDNGVGLFDEGYKATKSLSFELKGEKLLTEVTFPRESSYSFVMVIGSSKSPCNVHKVYAVNSDLYALRPFKGDTHIHSTVSDGKNSPEEVGARSLETGCDFQSLSDHRRWNGSAYLQDAFKDYPISMKILNAEECHLSEVHVHNFGSSMGMTQWVDENPDKFDQMVEDIRKTLPSEWSDFLREQVAITEAEFKVIRNLGGLAGFDHPYWRRNASFNKRSTSGGVFVYLPNELIETLIKRKNFDFVELTNGGCAQNSTDLALAAITEVRAEGIDYPVMGTSDGHHIKSQGSGHTIVFSKSAEFADIKDGILNHRGICMDLTAEREECNRPFLFGKKRYINYTWFLLNHYYANHDRLCKEQAKVLFEIIKKGQADSESIEKIQKFRDELFAYNKEFFGKA